MKMPCCKETSGNFRDKIRFCVGGRLRPEGLLIVSISYFGTSRLHGEMSVAINMPCDIAKVMSRSLRESN